MDCLRRCGVNRLHDLVGNAMNTDTLSPYILTLVTFVPLGGALLLTVLPRRDRDIRVIAFLVSLITFGLSLHLPVYFHRVVGGFQFRISITTWRLTGFPCGWWY